MIRNGGWFPMPAHDPECVYRSPDTVALHLYDYTARMWLGRRRVRLQPGDFTLTPAGLPTRYDLEEVGHHLCLHFEAQPAGAGAVRLPLHWRPGAQGRWLRERVQEVIHLHQSGRGTGAGAALAQQASAVTLQGLLLAVGVAAASARPGRREATAPSRVDGVLDEVRRHLDKHYREPLQIPALARAFAVSQNHLARCFRARYGTTVQGYVLSRRIELARHLMATTRLPLKAVAIEAGLGNPQYFHRQFVRMVGHSPSEEKEAGENPRPL